MLNGTPVIHLELVHPPRYLDDSSIGTQPVDIRSDKSSTNHFLNRSGCLLHLHLVDIRFGQDDTTKSLYGQD